MRSGRSAALLMGAAFCASFVLAAGMLLVLGPTERGVHQALRTTARLAFLFFWPAYSGSALTALFGARFQWLKRHARNFGLAFASVLTVHLGLVLWLCLIGAPPGTSTFVLFGAAAAWTYVLALFSIGRLQQALGRRFWRLLQAAGLNYIAFAFALDFLNNPLHGGLMHIVEYAPFAALAILGPGLRLAQFARRIEAMRREPSYRSG